MTAGVEAAGEAGPRGRDSLQQQVPKAGAKKGIGWHSEGVESGVRLCWRERPCRVSQKQMGYPSQPLCSPFLCQVTIEGKRFLLPESDPRPVLIVCRSYSKRGEGQTFTGRWSQAGRQPDDWNDQSAHTYDRAGKGGLGMWPRNLPSVTAEQLGELGFSPLSHRLGPPAWCRDGSSSLKIHAPLSLLSSLLSYFWVHTFPRFPS